MIYKNWLGICQVTNVHFRIALCYARGEEFLARLALGFPELFTNIQPEHPGPFPLSYLREVADAYKAKEGEGAMSHIQDGLEEAGMPYVSWAHPKSSMFNPETALALDIDTAEYQKFLEAYELDSRDMFPYTLHGVSVKNNLYYLGWVNPSGAEEGMEHERDIYLFPADLVDTSA